MTSARNESFAVSSFHHKLRSVAGKSACESLASTSSPTHLKNDRLAFRQRRFAEYRIHDFEEFFLRQLGRRVAIEIIDKVVQEEVCACGEKEKCEKIYGFKSMAFKVVSLRIPIRPGDACTAIPKLTSLDKGDLIRKLFRPTILDLFGVSVMNSTRLSKVSLLHYHSMKKGNCFNLN